MSDNHLTILVVEPGKPPYPRQIPDTLQAMQEMNLFSGEKPGRKKDHHER